MDKRVDLKRLIQIKIIKLKLILEMINLIIVNYLNN